MHLCVLGVGWEIRVGMVFFLSDEGFLSSNSLSGNEWVDGINSFYHTIQAGHKLCADIGVWR